MLPPLAQAELARQNTARVPSRALAPWGDTAEQAHSCCAQLLRAEREGPAAGSPQPWGSTQSTALGSW